MAPAGVVATVSTSLVWRPVYTSARGRGTGATPATSRATWLTTSPSGTQTFLPFTSSTLRTATSERM